MSNEIKTTGNLAIAIAEHARKCIGPEGTVLRVAEEDAQLVRSTFVTRIAEAAMNILERTP